MTLRYAKRLLSLSLSQLASAVRGDNATMESLCPVWACMCVCVCIQADNRLGNKLVKKRKHLQKQKFGQEIKT